MIRRPVRDFLKTFFLQQGYKDGFHGFVLSSLQAFYMLITYLKVWEKKGFTVSTKENFLHEFIAELRKLQKEVSYWVLTSSMTESSTFIKNIPLKIRRKYLSKKIQNESE